MSIFYKCDFLRATASGWNMPNVWGLPRCVAHGFLPSKLKHLFKLFFCKQSNRVTTEVYSVDIFWISEILATLKGGACPVCSASLSPGRTVLRHVAQWVARGPRAGLVREAVAGGDVSWVLSLCVPLSPTSLATGRDLIPLLFFPILPGT